MTDFAGGGGFGWNPMWGEKKVVQYIVPNIRPTQGVVDLAGAIGRVSFPFSMLGLEVIIVDIDSESMCQGNRMRERAGAKPARMLTADIRDITREKVGDHIGAVVACDALLFLGKTDADKVIATMPSLLGEEGGCVFLNVPATDSPIYRQPENYGAGETGHKTLSVPVGCHGGEIESGFFEQGEVDAGLALRGGVIVANDTSGREGGSIVYHEVLARFSPRTPNK